MKSFALALAALMLPFAAVAAGLPKGAVVRVQITGLGPDWHEGRITSRPDGCTMVALNQPTAEGYKSVALIGLLHLERKMGTTWTDVSLRTLIAQEPKQCLQEGAD